MEICSCDFRQTLPVHLTPKANMLEGGSMDYGIPAEVPLRRGLVDAHCVNIASTECNLCKYTESPRFSRGMHICEALIINHGLFTAPFCLT